MFLRNAISGEDAQQFLIDGALDGLRRPHELRHLASGSRQNISRNLKETDKAEQKHVAKALYCIRQGVGQKEGT